MNVRLGEAAIRFRISVDELACLLSGRALHETVAVGVHHIHLSIQVEAGSSPLRCVIKGDDIILYISANDCELLNTKRSKQGVGTRGGATEIAIQVDLKSYKAG